ncbi:MAG: lysine decarboxylase [Lautropia sp.]
MNLDPGLRLDVAGRLRDARGRRFDAATRGWYDAGPSSPADAVPATDPSLSLADAVRWLQTASDHPLRVPIGVIGPRDADPEQLAAAHAIGLGLGTMRLAVVCGGRHGVMQSVAEGVAAAGGVSIGLLPDATPDSANPSLTYVIATGLGEARNAIIARSAFCLVAIGDSFGTLSEVALGRQFGKAVFGLAGAARVEGVVHCADTRLALAAVAAKVLALD